MTFWRYIPYIGTAVNDLFAATVSSIATDNGPAVIKVVNQVVQKCPNTKIVLSGWVAP